MARRSLLQNEIGGVMFAAELRRRCMVAGFVAGGIHSKVFAILRISFAKVVRNLHRGGTKPFHEKEYGISTSADAVVIQR